MPVNRKSISRSLVLAAAGALLIATAETPAHAGPASPSVTSNNAQLNVSATVTGVLQLTLATGSGGVALTGTSTDASLSFGTTLNEYENTSGTNITLNQTPPTSLCTACFSVSTPISVIVNLADVASSSFTLNADVNSYSGGEVLQLGTTKLTTTSQQVLAAGTYGTSTPNSLNVTLGIPTGGTGAATYNDTINMTAVSN